MVNLNQFLKQAQAMQGKMQEMQSTLDSREYDGKAGGELVTIKITGRGELKALSIDDSLMDKEEKELLEDLIIAAFNDAKSKADAASKDEMGNMFGGMSLPPGFKMPF
ncbi:MAG UNVERIFIED_CONTAM: YbaB/EbfC family nucleoid-associated protein [Rickettsiaceae bacterium]|jgi:DNA-binding YbaB/EbfC family protein